MKSPQRNQSRLKKYIMCVISNINDIFVYNNERLLKMETKKQILFP